MQGRILYYNTRTGKSKLILKSNNKMDFTADKWNDFDQFPSAGSLVTCEIVDGVLVSIYSDPLHIPGQTPNQGSDNQSLQPQPLPAGHSSTFSVKETLEIFFKPIVSFIGEPPETIQTSKQLDFFLVKRFLMTAYNDLKGMDTSLHNNTKIKKILDEIHELQKAYKQVDSKLSKPRLAFEMIFLRSQPEYLQFIKYKEDCLNRITILGKIEESLFPDIQAMEDRLKVMPAEEFKERELIEKDLKSLKRHYVDTIHENAEIFEELSNMEDLRGLYVKKYSETFFIELSKIGGTHLETLRSILNYRAYSFDSLIWEHAAKSKIIREFLLSSQIEGEYTTLTFLQYFLRTLNKDNLNAEQSELLELESYLVDIEKKNKR
jgi:hypothetical protein